ncbi:hypothetical protein ABIB35_003551 [Arthrobacter sp. UYP6]
MVAGPYLFNPAFGFRRGFGRGVVNLSSNRQ